MSRSVAWTGTAEWVQVYNYLYSDNESDQHKGIARVCAWQARQKLPMAIEATSALRDCILKDKLLCALSEQEHTRTFAAVSDIPRGKDEQVTKDVDAVLDKSIENELHLRHEDSDNIDDLEDSGSDSDDAEVDQEDIMVGGTSQIMRLMYSMCVVRFVNGMVDSVQKGMHARSVSALASELGLPEWVVDFRHDATHTALPTLASCRMTAKFILEWLRLNYWQTQARYEPELQALLKTALKHYASVETQLHALSEAEAALSAANAQPAPAGKGKKKTKVIKPTKKAIASNTASVRALIDDRTATLDSVVRLCGSKGVACEMLIPMLLKTGMMVPAEKKLRPGSLLALGVECTATDPKNLRAWAAALSHFERVWPGFLSDMLSTMVSTLAEVSQPIPHTTSDSTTDEARVQPSPSRLRSIVCWAVYILNDHHADPKVFIDESVNRLQSVCIQWANEYTHTLLVHLLRFCSAEERQAQLDLMQLSYSNPTIKDTRSRQNTTVMTGISNHDKRHRTSSNTTDTYKDGNNSTAQLDPSRRSSEHVSEADIMALLSSHQTTGKATLKIERAKRDNENQSDSTEVSNWRLLIGHPAAVDVSDADSLTLTPAMFERLRAERRELRQGSMKRRSTQTQTHTQTHTTDTQEGSNVGAEMDCRPVDITANVLKRIRLY